MERGGRDADSATARWHDREEAMGFHVSEASFALVEELRRETAAALRLAVSWHLISEADSSAALELLDRILAMLWRLTKGRPTPFEIR